MARYKLTITCELDSAYGLSSHDDIARAIIRNCCPWFAGLNVERVCINKNCVECWFKALEKGVRADAVENVHVERLG